MEISVIIPFFNEQDNVRFVIREAVEVLRRMGGAFEIVAVNDGSRDQTGKNLADLAQEIDELVIIEHTENLGQGAAFFAGFDAARGEAVVTVDGDGQNDFRDVPRMISLLDHYDAVFGQRMDRKDSYVKRFLSRGANAVRSRLLGDGIQDTGCSLKVMKRRTLQYLIPFEHVFLFIPFLFKHAGLSYLAVPVRHRVRMRGRSKYSFAQYHYYSYLLDLFFILWFKKTSLNTPFLRNRRRRVSMKKHVQE